MEDLLQGSTAHYEHQLHETIQSELIKCRVEGLPDIVEGIIVLEICSSMWKNVTNSYDNFPDHLKKVISQREFHRAFTGATAKVMSRFLVEVPPPFNEYL